MFGTRVIGSDVKFRPIFLISMLGMLPVFGLVTWLLSDPVYLICASVLIPACLIAVGLSQDKISRASQGKFVDRKALMDSLQEGLSTPSCTHSTACLALEIDPDSLFSENNEEIVCPDVGRHIADRLAASLRGSDTVCQFSDSRFVIALPDVRLPDLGAILSLTQRLQAAVSEPLVIENKTVRVSLSAGFCLEGRAPARTAKAMLNAAFEALADAQRHAPAAVRSFSATTPKPSSASDKDAAEFLTALKNGEIIPWFQPQISSDTGKVVGFEALARWDHPERGSIPPRDFLPALREAGRLEELSEVILNQSLKALKSWDRAGFDVPTISVNFDAQDLRNPGLVERIKWDVDRFSLEPHRLTVEILETVISNSDDDIIARNIRSLGAEGFRIDLDDFGTGHASLASVRRFNVDRIKIARAFVSHVDEDPEQQKMIAAIISLADHLEIETLAEGVETLGEKSLLAQLGCSAMQGFSIGRPMPFEDTMAWLKEHEAKLYTAPTLPRRAG